MVSSLSVSSEEDIVTSDILKHINKVLMDDKDMQTQTNLLRDSLALQAIRSLYDALDMKYPPSQEIQSLHSNFSFNRNIQSSYDVDRNGFRFSPVRNWDFELNLDYFKRSNVGTFGSDSSCEVFTGGKDTLVSSFRALNTSDENNAFNDGVLFQNIVDNTDFGAKRSYHRGVFWENGGGSKQFASSIAYFGEQPEMFDELLLCHPFNSYLNSEPMVCISHGANENGKQMKNEKLKGLHKGKVNGKTLGNRIDVVHLLGLLQKGAESVASNDTRTTNELLRQIRKHSSANGDGMQRLAHYMVGALEARLAGTGIPSDGSFSVRQLSARDTVKALLDGLKVCPFILMSYFFANKSIVKLAENQNKLHIIDFGIMNGFQWPHLIKHLSERLGGPPSVRITGIDFPQSGFWPAERASETGLLLAYYCKKFGVPFDYTGIAKKWDTVELEDIHIQ